MSPATGAFGKMLTLGAGGRLFTRTETVLLTALARPSDTVALQLKFVPRCLVVGVYVDVDEINAPDASYHW